MKVSEEDRVMHRVCNFTQQLDFHGNGSVSYFLVKNHSPKVSSFAECLEFFRLLPHFPEESSLNHSQQLQYSGVLSESAKRVNTSEDFSSFHTKFLFNKSNAGRKWIKRVFILYESKDLALIIRRLLITFLWTLHKR